MEPSPSWEGLHRVAVADLGSQALRLEIAEVDQSGLISSLYRERHPLMLARRGALAEDDIDQIVAVLEAFAGIAERHHAQLRIAATAVFRAQPPAVRAALTQRILQRAGVRFCILSPRQEAALSLRGTASSMGLTGRFLHVVVGGGSSQVSMGDGLELVDTVSIPEGAGTLTRWIEALCIACPIARLREAAEHAAALMSPAARFAHAAALGVGTGGTAKTLARLEALLAGRPEPVCRPIYLSADGLDAVLTELGGWASPRVGVERYHLTPDRAEVLRAGALLLRSGMSALGLTRIEVCQDGIRAGVLRADPATWRRFEDDAGGRPADPAAP